MLPGFLVASAVLENKPVSGFRYSFLSKGQTSEENLGSIQRAVADVPELSATSKALQGTLDALAVARASLATGILGGRAGWLTGCG